MNIFQKSKQNVSQFFSGKKGRKNNDNIILPKSELYVDDNLTVNDQVEINHQQRMADSKTLSLTLARANPPQPKSDLDHPHSAEIKIQADYQSDVNLLYNTAMPRVEELQNTYAEKLNNCEEKAGNRSQIDEKVKKSVQEKLQIEKDNLEKNHAEDIANVDNEIQTTSNKIKNLEIDQEEPENTLLENKDVIPTKRIPVYYILALIGIGILEYPLNSLTFRVMREDKVSTFLMSLVVSLIIVISSHYGGKYLKLSHKNFKDKAIIFFSILIPLIISYIVGNIRHEYLLARDIEILSTYGLGFLNFALFAVGLFLSYHVGHRNPDLVKQYRDLAKKIDKKKRELEQLQNKKKSIENRFSNDLQILIEREEAEVERKIEKHFIIPREEVIELANEINTIVTSATSLEQVIVSNLHSCLTTFRSINEQRRIDPRPQYWNEANLPSMKLYFTQYELLHPFQESRSARNNPGSNGSDTSKKTTINSQILSKINSAVFGIALLLSLLLSGCESGSPPKHTAVYVGIDITESYLFTDPLTAVDILTLAQIDEGHPRNSVDVYFTFISDVSLSKVKKLSLSPGTQLGSVMEREDEIKEFEVLLNAALRSVFQPSEEGLPYSQIYPRINEILNQTAKVKADNKYVFFYSDMFENGNQSVSFYNYNQNPKGIMENYNTITASFESLYPLSDLSGINIYTLGYPSFETDAMFIYARKFWTKFFESKNAHVSYIANYQQ
ncbi:MAG: hypothetical protein R2764_08300 [Bacteroidales bacterium]